MKLHLPFRSRFPAIAACMLLCLAPQAASLPDLDYSSFLGGPGTDTASAIARDTAGHIWIAGTTSSQSLLGHERLAEGGPGGSTDIFVAKLDERGRALLGLALFGGSSADRVKGLACSIDGVWVVGETESGDFPSLGSPRARSTGLETWIAKLDASAGHLVLSTFLGGTADDAPTGCVIDTSGRLWICGWTDSADFPVANPFGSSASGREAFVTCLGQEGVVISSTLFGGSGADHAWAIAVESSGDLLVVGETESADFPTRNASQLERRGASDGFVVRFTSNASQPIYSTYLGGNAADAALGVAAGSSGSAWVCGRSTSTDVLPGTSGGAEDAFVLELNGQGTRTGAGGWVGGIGNDAAACVAVADDGAVWVAGGSSSPNLIGPHALQPMYAGGGRDAFVACLQPTTSTWEFATLLGSSESDEATALLANHGQVHLIGSTVSSDRGQCFPTSFNALRGSYQGGHTDGFWCRINAHGIFPANDAISGAVELSGTRFTTFATTADATAEPGEPAHAGVAAAHSLWWTWQAPTNGLVVLSTAGSSGDTGLSVYRGSRQWSEPIVENRRDPAGGPGSRLVFMAEAGSRYTIAVDSAGIAAERVVLTLSLGQAPNDDFRHATVIDGIPATTSADLSLATIETGEPPHGEYSPAHSVWWQWTAPADMDVSLDLRSSTVDGRLFMAIYTGDRLEDLKRVTSDNSGNRKDVVFAAKRGLRYSIAVDSSPPGTGTVILNLAATRRIPNDDFAQRIVLSDADLPYTTTVDLRQATSEPGEGLFSSRSGNSAWWTFTPTTTGNYEIISRGDNLYPWLLLYSGSAVDSLSLMLFNTWEPMAPTPGARLTLRGVAGQAYHLCLDSSYYGTPGPASLDIHAVEGPANDDFDQRIVLSGAEGQRSGTVVNASHPVDDPWGYIDVLGTVWYEWQAPSDGNLSLWLSGGLDHFGDMQIYRSTPETGLSRVTGFRAAYAAENCDYPCIVQEAGVQVRQGQVLFIEVGGSIGAMAPFDLHWRLVPLIPNDDFDHPVPLEGLACTLAGSNVGASVQERESQHVMRGGNGGHSLWWQWTAPSAGLVEITINSPGLRVMLDVYEGDSLENIVRIASNGLGIYGPPYTNQITFPTAAGITYRISLDTDGSTGLLSATLVDRPALHFGAVRKADNGDVILEIAGSTDRQFRVESSTDLRTWSPLATLQLVDHKASFNDASPGSQRKFYRAVEVP
jgi:hypothetical protein